VVDIYIDLNTTMNRKEAKTKSDRLLRKMKLHADKKKKAIETDTYSSYQSLIPAKIDSKSAKFPLNEYMKANIILPHPSSYLFIGASGSGKSNTMVWMINQLMEDYFDEIIIFSGTGGCDDMLNSLTKGPKMKIKVHTTDLINKVTSLLKDRQKEAEDKGVSKLSRMLVIFEDVSSQKKLLNSVAFIQSYVQLRHFGCSVISCSHKLKAVSRLARINANGVVIFPSSVSEKKQLVEEYAPNNLTSREFEQVIEHAWRDGEDMAKPFLFINLKVKQKDRFRRGLHEILQLND